MKNRIKELRKKYNFTLDDASNLAGFTADDLDVVDQIKTERKYNNG